MIPYRIRQFYKRIFLGILTLLLIVALVGVVCFVWLQRFIVYTDKGVVFDFGLQNIPQGEFVSPPEPLPTVSILYADEEDEDELLASNELAQMIGYYIDTDDLADIPTVREQLSQLPAGTPVMVNVKNIYGSYFYSSKVCDQRVSSIDTAAVDGLFAYMQELDLYPIARLPALRDRYYGDKHVPDGLPEAGGGGWLWPDEYSCYWLNPTREGTLNYLIDTISELKSRGFREVVLYDFRFPDTENITFDGDKQQAIANAAKTLVTSCATDKFALSFEGLDVSFPLPEGRSRLYLSGVAASEAASIANLLQVGDPTINLVFLTSVHDTRFDQYSVLRPLSAAP